MKRKIVLILCVCIGVGFLNGSNAISENPQSTNIIKATSETQDKTFLTVNYNIPSFSESEENKEVLLSINQYFQNIMPDYANNYIENLQNTAKEIYEQQGISSEVMLNAKGIYLTERYISVILTVTERMGITENASLASFNFALDGQYAGGQLSLSQTLGLEEQQAQNGEMLSTTIAYKVVWDSISQTLTKPENDYLDGLTIEQLKAVFNPETDYYLDEKGQVVFYIQSGEIASAMAGILTYSFTKEELMFVATAN